MNIKVILQKFLTFLIPALWFFVPSISLWIRHLYITLEQKSECFSETSQQSFIAKVHFAFRSISEIWNLICLDHLMLIKVFIWWKLVAWCILIIIWTTLTHYYVIFRFFIFAFNWIIQQILGRKLFIMLILDVSYIFHQISLVIFWVLDDLGL